MVRFPIFVLCSEAHITPLQHTSSTKDALSNLRHRDILSTSLRCYKAFTKQMLYQTKELETIDQTLFKLSPTALRLSFSHVHRRFVLSIKLIHNLDRHIKFDGKVEQET